MSNSGGLGRFCDVYAEVSKEYSSFIEEYIKEFFVEEQIDVYICAEKDNLYFRSDTMNVSFFQNLLLDKFGFRSRILYYEKGNTEAPEYAKIVLDVRDDGFKLPTVVFKLQEESDPLLLRRLEQSILGVA